MKIKQDEQLVRSVGVFGLSANIVNIIIGSGIFVLPAVVAAGMGSSAIYAYLFCGILITCIMLCFAEAGSKINKTGGPYTYIETAFGPFAGFLAGVFSVLSSILSVAAVSNALVNIAAVYQPVLQETFVRFIFLLFVFGGLAFVNVLGIKQGIGLVKMFVLFKLTPLLLIIVFGWSEVSYDNLNLNSFPGIEALGATSLILFFAFLGAESAVTVGGEVLRPKKTFPQAILIGILTVLAVYVMVQLVAQGVLGEELKKYTSAPLAETARRIMGNPGFVLLVAGAALSMFGNLSGQILNVPRVLYALSRDKVIPVPYFSRVHKKYKTPHTAIIIYSIIGLCVAVAGSFEKLAVISTSTALLLYLGVVMAVVKLRFTQKASAEEFQVPGGLIIPILSILIILYFLSHLSRNEIGGTIILITILSILFYLNKWVVQREALPKS